jgi:glycosyltransferase involved in cell wall biosynthesis
MTAIPLAFYAPMKPPFHPNPSGDRRIAQLLMQALHLAGFNVALASVFRSRDGRGDADYQQRIQTVGSALAKRLIRRYQALPANQQPKIWFTYHLYHKAPDWIGPEVAQALNIPYVVAEASYAPKQLQGPWHSGVQASINALQHASVAFFINPVDQACLSQALPSLKQQRLAPFLDLASLGVDELALLPASEKKPPLAAQWQLNPDCPWLITVAMMRTGDKSHSYRLLADALTRIKDKHWQLLIVGDGDNAREVKGYFAELEQVRFLGQLEQAELMPLLNASEAFVWPAVNEAFGIALLEAQAAGTLVLAGAEGGVDSIMRDGTTGVLTPPRDVHAFAEHLTQLLNDLQKCHTMGIAAGDYIHQYHSLNAAAQTLSDTLMPLLHVIPSQVDPTR